MTDHAQAHEHAHPSVGFYAKVAIFLTIVTAIEVIVILPDVKAWYGEAMPWVVPLIIPSLFIMSIVKFAVVVACFMHLAQDKGATRSVFIAPLILATAMILVLMLLYSIFQTTTPKPQGSARAPVAGTLLG